VLLFAYQNSINPWQDIDFNDAVATARNGNPVNQGLVLALGALGLAILRTDGARLHLRGRVAGVLLTFLIWVGLSAFWADDTMVAIRRQVAFGSLLCFCAGCAARLNGQALGLFVAGLAGLNAVGALIQELVRGTLQPFAGGSRFAGTVSPNIQGASLSLALLLVLWCAWRAKRLTRLTSICTSAIVTVLLLMTGSRTSLLGVASALLVSAALIAIRKNRANPLRIAVAIMLLSALAIGMAMVSATTIAPVGGSDLFDAMRMDRDSGSVSDLTGRDVIWEICLRYAAERPILGFGYGSFWTGSRLDAVATELKWAAHHGHSAYLDVFLQLGMPGVVLFILLLITCAVKCIRRFMADDDIAGSWTAAFVFVAINGLTESIIVLPTFPAVVTNLLVMKVGLAKTN
jgi:O-antigen ligase